MENRKATEAGQDITMQKEDFAALWKTIHLKVTDTYEVPPEILWVNGSTIGTLGNFSASTGKAKSKKTFNISAIVAAAVIHRLEKHLNPALAAQHPAPVTNVLIMALPAAEVPGVEVPRLRPILGKSGGSLLKPIYVLMP